MQWCHPFERASLFPFAHVCGPEDKVRFGEADAADYRRAVPEGVFNGRRSRHRRAQSCTTSVFPSRRRRQQHPETDCEERRGAGTVRSISTGHSTLPWPREYLCPLPDSKECY